MKRVYLHTLGCKVNQFETAAFADSLRASGLHLVDDPARADVIVINTCAVTAKASAQSRRDLRRLARVNPGAVLAVTGCHVQLAATELRALPDLHPERLLLVGNDRKNELVDFIVHQHRPAVDPSLTDMESARPISRLPIGHFAGRTRALLRVQDGCNHFCSYCIVPFTRGRSRSLPLAEILDQVASYREHGHKEVVVTGIHVGQYGNDLAEGQTVVTLLETLCSRFPELRFRLSSIEPTEINEELLSLMRERDNFMPHLHIPLQSGDAFILARMNRSYRPETFVEKLTLCRRMVTDAAIGIDVLVGFPGERQSHFDNTVSLLEQTDFTYLHAFPYSPRPGTRAAAFADQVPNRVKQQRVALLRELSERRRNDFYRRFLGTRRPALIESERDRDGLLQGHTDNYVTVRVDGDDRLINRVVQVELSSVTATGVTARPEAQP